MTPEECARFILSDCQDPELRAKSERENAEALTEALKDPATKARWVASIKAFVDDYDAKIAAEICKEFYHA